MKPGTRIVQIAKEMAQEEAKKRGTYLGWEGRDMLAEAILNHEYNEIITVATVKYLLVKEREE